MHVGSLTRGGGENVPGIPDACATHNFTYEIRSPSRSTSNVAMYTALPDSTYLVPSSADTCQDGLEAGNCDAFLANCPTNPTTCSDVRQETDCALAESECNATTCHCPLDMVLGDDGSCIQPSDCNCRVEISGALVAPGSVVQIDECETW